MMYRARNMVPLPHSLVQVEKPERVLTVQFTHRWVAHGRETMPDEQSRAVLTQTRVDAPLSHNRSHGDQGP